MIFDWLMALSEARVWKPKCFGGDRATREGEARFQKATEYLSGQVSHQETSEKVEETEQKAQNGIDTIEVLELHTCI